MGFEESGRALAQRDPWGPLIDDERQRVQAAMASGYYNSLVTPLGVLLDDPAARAILQARIPQVIGNEQIGMARGFTLAALADYMPQVLTREMLASIDADFAKLPKR